jgi:hypothetical protein
MVQIKISQAGIPAKNVHSRMVPLFLLKRTGSRKALPPDHCLLMYAAFPVPHFFLFLPSPFTIIFW